MWVCVVVVEFLLNILVECFVSIVYTQMFGCSADSPIYVFIYLCIYLFQHYVLILE